MFNDNVVIAGEDSCWLTTLTTFWRKTSSVDYVLRLRTELAYGNEKDQEQVVRLRDKVWVGVARTRVYAIYREAWLVEFLQILNLLWIVTVSANQTCKKWQTAQRAFGDNFGLRGIWQLKQRTIFFYPYSGVKGLTSQFIRYGLIIRKLCIYFFQFFTSLVSPVKSYMQTHFCHNFLQFRFTHLWGNLVLLKCRL